MMIRTFNGVIHTGYYSEEATHCFQLILRVVNSLYIRRTDLAMYNDRRIIRAPDGELLLHYDISLRQDIEDYYKTIFSRFKRDSSNYSFDYSFDSIVVYDRVYARIKDCIQLCNAELKGKRLKKLVGVPLIDQFKVSALEMLYSDCLKTMEEGHDSATIEKLESLMRQVRETFYS